MSRARQAAVAALLAVLAGGCGGYAELPIPLREEATLVVESADLHPGAAGKLQLRLDFPDDVDAPSGPVLVVGPPAAIATNVDPTVINWAYGTCDGANASASPLRVCLAVFMPPGELPVGMRVGLIVDSRTESRRFSAIGDVEVTW